MNLLSLFDHLNEDLQREFAHWHFYMNAATAVRGLHREEISEFLMKEAAGEQKHIEEFQRMLHGLKTRRDIQTLINHTASPADYVVDLTDPVDILKFALKMEDTVVQNYVQRIDECVKLQETGDIEDKVDGKYIELFLEDQILDSRSDADHIREMLEGLGH